jgi:2-polyprenyl-3-methyl-5-hydroxy-6-metoxy-1,4-benzoquinol methylase
MFSGLRKDGFQNALFWNRRYATHPERGSGLGSRGQNAAYKRELLRAQGIEAFGSILDIGCGDLEVVSQLNLRNYTGVDVSLQSIIRARMKRPDWNFVLHEGQEIGNADPVLCLEVLIHQRTLTEYRSLVRMLGTA